MRKRVNISVDPATFSSLHDMAKRYGFRNICELMVALAHIMLDRIEKAENRRFDLPESDGAYIDAMFDDLSRSERMPDGVAPRIHRYKKLR